MRPVFGPSQQRRTGQRRVGQRGVTLIELMIAVSLTAIITVGLLFALRTSVLAYEKTSGRLHSNREQMGRNQILASELGGAMPVVLPCAGVALPFFAGTPSALRMVSSYSIAEGFRGYPQILVFQVTPSPSGGVRLIVTEHPYTGPLSASVFCGAGEPTASDTFPGPPAPPFVLADDLTSCEFLYHQPVDMLAYKDSDWLPLWNGPRLPAGIRVAMQPRTAAGGGLPVVSVTAPLRTDRDVMQQYADF